MKKNYFIVFEGIEKVGKTTNIKFVYDYLIKLGYKVLLTREPGGTLLGENIRNIILQFKKITYIKRF